MATQAGIERCHQLVERASRRAAANPTFFVHDKGQPYERFNLSLWTRVYVADVSLARMRRFQRKLDACLGRYNAYDFVDEEDERQLDDFVAELVAFKAVVEGIVEVLRQQQADARRAERDVAEDSIAGRVMAWRSGAAHRPGGIGYQPPQANPPLGYHLGVPYYTMEELQSLIQLYHGSHTNPEDWTPRVTNLVITADVSAPAEPLVDPSPWRWGSLSAWPRPRPNTLSEWDFPIIFLPHLQLETDLYKIFLFVYLRVGFLFR